MEETIGERVRRLRKDKGWTQVVLAYNADRAPSVVSQVETGKRDPELATIKKFAEALEVDWRYLLLGEQLPKASRSSLEQLLKAAGVKTRWFVIPQEEWLEAFRGPSTTEAAQQLVDIAVQMEAEFGELISIIHFGPPNPLGSPTVPHEYVDVWRRAAQRRIRTYFALEDLEEDQTAPEDLRDQARMILQSMRKTSDEEFDRLLPGPQERAAGRSYV